MSRQDLRVVLFGAGVAAFGVAVSSVLAGLTARAQRLPALGTAPTRRKGSDDRDGRQAGPA